MKWDPLILLWKEKRYQFDIAMQFGQWEVFIFGYLDFVMGFIIVFFLFLIEPYRLIHMIKGNSSKSRNVI